MRDEGTSSTSKLPLKIRKFLTVTEPDGAPHTGRVEPSALLSRVEAFLPRLKSANDALHDRPSSESVVQVEKVESNAEVKPNTTDEAVEGALRINMDLYVDESLGELVGGVTKNGSKGVQQEGGDSATNRKRPLIQVISDGNDEKTEQVPSKKTMPDCVQ